MVRCNNVDAVIISADLTHFILLQLLFTVLSWALLPADYIPADAPPPTHLASPPLARYRRIVNVIAVLGCYYSTYWILYIISYKTYLSLLSSPLNVIDGKISELSRSLLHWGWRPINNRTCFVLFSDSRLWLWEFICNALRFQCIYISNWNFIFYLI